MPSYAHRFLDIAVESPLSFSRDLGVIAAGCVGPFQMR